MFGYRIEDEFGGNDFVGTGDNILQRFGSQVDVDWFFLEAAAGFDPFERAFQFAYVGTDVFGDEKSGILAQSYAGRFGFFLQNGNAHFKFRRFEFEGQTPGKPRFQTVVHVFDFGWKYVAG